MNNLARNFKHLTIVFDSNYFNTIIYTKRFNVLGFVRNKSSLNHFYARKCQKNIKNIKNTT